MSMLGLKSLPLNHRLGRAYRVCAGVVGVALAVFGALALLLSGDRLLGVTAGPAAGIGAAVVGLVLVAAAVAGGNTAAEVNALAGALLMVVGLACLLVMRTEDWNVLDARMTDVVVLFVVGFLLLTFGVYGRVGSVPARH